MKITVSKIIKGVRYLKHYGFREFLIRLKEKAEAEQVPYQPWYERHKADKEQLAAQRKKAAGWKDAPLISIVVPLYCTKEEFLREMIASVQAQTYGNWQLCLADASPKEAPGACELEKLALDYAKEDARIVYKHLPKNYGIAGNTNKAVELATGEWIGFMDHDDLLAPDALYETVRMIRQGFQKKTGLEAASFFGIPEDGACYDMIYTDEDKVDMDGREHFQPHFKPDFNLDLLRSNNYITHFLLVRRSLFEQVGGLRSEYDGAQDYDFILRCAQKARAIGHVPRILYHWRTHKESTSENPFSKQYAVDAGKRALEEHLKNLGVPAQVSAAKDMGFYTVKYPVWEEPLISIIIPSKDETEALRKCIASVAQSSYQNFEIIVVENNSMAETFDFYRSITEREERKEGVRRFEGTLPGGQRICIAVWEDGFHYSRLNNFGVMQARGSYFLLLNNDIELMDGECIAELLGTCERKEVGAVGAKLFYPDGTVQHAGVVVGIGGNARGIAQNMFSGMQGERSGYLHKASIAMDYSAVTAACMMVKREVYEAVNGFEEKLAVAFNDVDFCLKVRKLGYLIVYQPRAKAWHYESKSRGAEDSPEKVARFQREIEYMRTNWIGILKNGDPYYNPNFSSVSCNYTRKDNS
ncbi:MAG: glycosyltransferase family 2 protein [Clostridiales bacterium]|nr:glycosyltransferase family 2 protein [Clostridiales bacterium]